MTINTIALWIGIAGSGAAVYFPMHEELLTHEQVAIQQAQREQQAIDAISRRFETDEAYIAFIGTQMPKDKREILNELRKVQQEFIAKQ